MATPAKRVTARERTLQAMGKAPKAAGVLRFTIDGNTYDLDARTMTIRENFRASQILEASGFPADSSHFRTCALCLVIINRTHPDVTFDDVIDTMTLGDILDSSEEITEDLSNPER